jgi:2-keto-4-pentenoate hydratase/2-oxohepta-3-ene-1,7-dioic acid hydratase in catechol pathway
MTPVQTLTTLTSVYRGTPPGEGFKRKPQFWLKHGNICKIKGTHGLGTLINPVVEEGKSFRAKL